LTSPIAFEGRVYAAFTGQGAEEAFRAERLFEAVERLQAQGSSPFTMRSRDLIVASLALGDATVRRSGLRRAEHAMRGRDVFVPEADVRDRVTWTSKDIDELLDAAGAPRDALDPIVSQLGQGREDTDPDYGTLAVRPIVELVDGSVVVVHHLLRAVAHAILSWADGDGVLQDVAEAFADGTANSVDETLIKWSGLEPDDTFKPAVPRPLATRLRIYGAEPDAIIVATTICDPLTTFSPAAPYDGWRQTNTEHDALTAFVREAVDWAKANAAPDAVVLALCAFSISSGRTAMFRQPDLGKDVELLGIEAGALEVAAFTEHDDPLALVRFAISRRELHERMEVMTWSALDEFVIYDNHDRGFYMSDDRRMDLISIGSDVALPLREATLDKMDRQSAPRPYGPVTNHVEIIRRYEEEAAPIYFPFRSLAGPTMLVRLTGADIWVTAPRRRDIPDAAVSLYLDALDAIAFWVWQVGPEVLGACPPVGPNSVRKTIAFEIKDPEKWSLQGADPMAANSVNFDLLDGDLGRLWFLRSFSNGLMRPDNAGERYLAASLVEILFELFGGSTDSDAIGTILDRVVPRGQKKMMIVLPEEAGAEIGLTAGLPDRPKTSEWEAERLLDGLAAKLEADGKRPGRSGTPNEQSDLVNEAVDFFFEEMKRDVAEFSPDGLVEALLARSEAALRELALGRIQTPTRVACFGAYSDIAAMLIKETRELSTASIANRFLAEFVAASPPNGAKPLSRRRYERVLTAAALVVNYGYQSDIARYELGATSVRVLPSGRLGISATDFGTAVGAHLSEMIPLQIRARKERFASHWQIDAPPASPPDGLEEAFAAEFGYDVTTFAAVLQVLADASAIDRPVTVKKRSLLIADAVAKGLDGAIAGGVLDDVTLSQRASYEVPPAPFVGQDVWPWLFNRRLSLLRRPLVARGTSDPDLVWGYRGLVMAARQLLGVISEGRLPFPRSKEMKDFEARLTSKASDEFVDQAAVVLYDIGLEARKKVDKFGPLRLEESRAHSLGDVDVLGIDNVTHTLWAVECKDLVFAKTPREFSSELRSLEDPDKGLVAKHQRRVDWMRAHLTDVVSGLGLSGDWRVEPMMVVSAPLPAVHLRRLAMPVVVLDNIREWMAVARTTPFIAAVPKDRAARRPSSPSRGRGRRIGRSRCRRR